MKNALFGAAIALIAVNAPGLSLAQTPLTPPAPSSASSFSAGAGAFPPKGGQQVLVWMLRLSGITNIGLVAALVANAAVEGCLK